MTEPLVRIEGVSKRFGKAVAVDRLDMEIPAGQFVTFLGPSGCGKSTTLRILGGFETPDTGRILLDGQDVTSLPPNRRKVNMVFQDYALFPHMSVRRNIAFGLELQGLSRRRIDMRLDELMAFLELAGLDDRYPEQLSGGQRQRVALARALAPDPALLLLDEPLGALDAKLRGQVQEELKAIQRRTDKTFFFVTHDQDEALTMSDRIVVMNAGRVEQDGTPEALYHHPVSRFVAGFIGETNLLGGTVARNEGDMVIFDWLGLRMAGQGARPSPGSDVTASLRLENIVVAPEKPATDWTVEAEIAGKMFHGSRVTVDLRVGQGGVLRAYLDPETAARLGGGTVWAGWNTRHVAVLRD